jgi:hypothetical protein
MEMIISAVGALTQLYVKYMLAKQKRGEKTAEAEAAWRKATDLKLAADHWQVEPDPTA